MFSNALRTNKKNVDFIVYVSEVSAKTFAYIYGKSPRRIDVSISLLPSYAL